MAVMGFHVLIRKVELQQMIRSALILFIVFPFTDKIKKSDLQFFLGPTLSFRPDRGERIFEINFRQKRTLELFWEKSPIKLLIKIFFTRFIEKNSKK